MKTTKTIFTLFLAFSIGIYANTQDKFTSCSAAFLNNKIIVDKYAPEGKCRLSKNVSGKLIVAEATHENNQWHITNPFEFMIAIRDANTQTLMMYSKELYREIDIAKIMEKCRKGDSIVIMTMNEKYALPHNEILVQQ